MGQNFLRGTQANSGSGLSVPNTVKDPGTVADVLIDGIIKMPRNAETIPVKFDLDELLTPKTIPDYDPKKLLDNPKVNPVFSALIKNFLKAAVNKGFSPVVHEVYRSPERSMALATAHAHGGPPAAKVSMHNFGLAADIKLRTQQGKEVSFGEPGNPFKYPKWVEFIKIGENMGLINGKEHDDTDHYEYHPRWSRTDWLSAKSHALPVYNATNGTELTKLQAVWRSAGL